MISLFRAFAKSKWAAGLFVLLILSFLVVGGSQTDIFSSLGPKHIVTAGDRSVDALQFRTEFERVRTGMQEQAGRPVTNEDLVKENVHVRYLEGQTNRLGFLDWAYKAGIRVSEELVLTRIREIPAFFNQVTGQFDQAQYEQALAAQNVTPVMLEDEFRDTAVSQHYGTAIQAGLRTPRIYGALLAGQAFQVRDGRWFEVTQAMAGTTPAPTDAQLTAFINENAAQLRRPEFRIATVLLFNDAPGFTPPAIPEARVVERFNFRKDALSTPERRTFTTLTVSTQAAADRIAGALRAGQTPQAVAEANSIQPAVYDAQPRSALPDPAVATAVFGLAANQVSAPIQGRVGFTVAKVSVILPGTPATLDSVREAVTAELQEEDMKARVYARVEAYEKARTEGKPLAAAAEQVGARFVQLPPFTQDGRLPDGQPMNAPPQILQSAYALTKGGESDVIDAGQGQYFVLRLDDIRPAALPTLAEIRGPLAEQWTQRENARRLSTKAEELATRVRGGQDIAAVAASAGATLINRTGLQQNAETQTALGQGVLEGLFGQARGQVFTGPGTENRFVVGRVDAVRSADPATASRLADQIRSRIGNDIVTAGVEQLVTAAAVRSKAKNDPAAAVAALGVTAPAATPTAPAQ
ncbi:peptidylprolyl isomerase [Brevundimonas subvibrioides]|uniref:Parvulin-like PPIase n=1 Tax=Brevundimonas subvibrioides (strain ATCC 15264 / DSM 4735 / LMG 14903 / NBRC 16000 / CB 81) TaxID=633149 RepID=D9QIW5_BRESC|nr:peptidylprolyl isomerase [Brevundimonas subvibrioides]ADL01448.1 rotamase family protein [Brevundimonas subvibrioides ATCC 15264]